MRINHKYPQFLYHPQTIYRCGNSAVEKMEVPNTLFKEVESKLAIAQLTP